MTIVRLRLRYAQGDLGASETYWMPDLSIGQASANTTAAKLLQEWIDRRTGCMFTNQLVTSISIGYEGYPRSGVVIRPGPYPWPSRSQSITVPAAGRLTITPVSRRPEQLKVAVNVRFTFGINPLEGKSSTRYFSTVPDSVTNYDPNGVIYDSDQEWWQRWRSFRQLLTGGSGVVPTPFLIKAKQNFGAGLPVAVSGLVLKAAGPSLVGIQIENGAVPNEWVKGTVLNLAGFRMADCPCPTINGRWVIESRSTAIEEGYTTFFLLNSATVDISKVRHLGTAQAIIYQFQPIIDAVIYRASTHDRGNAGLRRAGRRSRRCCKP